MDDIETYVAQVREIDSVPTILDVVCRTTGMGFAAVARVTDTKWVACEVLDNIHFGLAPGGELPLESTICHEIRAVRQEVVIDHVADDPIYAQHHTPKMYGFQSYISVPIITADGEFFGTLCAIDPEPRKLKGTAIQGMFRLFARLIAFHLDANQKLNLSRADLGQAQAELENSEWDLATSRADLERTKATSELREQFIAVLGHDLRNPLGSIEAGRRLLSREIDDPKAQRVLRLIGESVSRIGGLIENLMDFARGRLGSGIDLQRTADKSLELTLAQVVNEIKATYPERAIETRLRLPDAVNVDHARIAQMFSNLVGNAIAHGAEDKPIVIDASVAQGQLEVSIANGGDPIPDAAMKRLFQPFYRGEIRPSAHGLGLGLYIASQIAVAHGGRLDVTSDAQETRFTFRMPLDA